MNIQKTSQEIMTIYKSNKRIEKCSNKSTLFQLINYNFKEEIEEIATTIPLYSSIYIVKSSCGGPSWAKCPWIAITNKEITNTIKEGVYILIIFSEDMQRYYITLNQGFFQINKELKTKLGREKLVRLRNELRNKYEAEGFKTDNNLVIGDIDYEVSTIFYKEYKQENLPNENQIKEDLEILFEVYQKYYEEYFLGSVKNTEEKSIAANIIIENFRNEMNSEGFIYSYEFICNFYLALKTKPFVILAGPSGTGKSKFVELYAKSMGATVDNGQYNLISVSSDWNDSTELLGYKNILGEFIPGKMTKIIGKAQKNKNNSYFICLDEMNLSRVEQYLSEYLSKIESRQFINRTIITNPIFTEDDLPEGNEYRGIIFPENLYIIGTLNIDESTFPISKKVLDRTNIIEITKTMERNLEFSEKKSTSIIVSNDFCKSQFLTISDAVNADREYVNLIESKLVEIDKILEPFSMDINHRVRNEIIYYMLENKQNKLLDEELAFDYQIKQRILPKITGYNEDIKIMLIELYKYCTDGVELNSNGDYVKEAEENLYKAKYKLSANKIKKMLRGYRNGYASFL